MLRAWALCAHRTSLCAHYAHAYKCPRNFLRPVKHRISTHRKKKHNKINSKKNKIYIINNILYILLHSQNINLFFRNFRWQIWDYLKKMKFSYTKFFFLSGFSFTGINSQDSRGTDLKILKNISLQLWNWHDYLLFSFVMHDVTTRLLLDDTYPLVGISIWLI